MSLTSTYSKKREREKRRQIRIKEEDR